MSASDYMKDASSKFQEMLKNAGVSQEEATARAANLHEQLSKVVLDAALESSKNAAAWSEETIMQMAELSKAKSDQTEVTESMSEFAKLQAEAAMRNLTALAQLAQKVQVETMEIYSEAGKDMLSSFPDAKPKKSKKK